jgi:hypothetical protein
MEDRYHKPYQPPFTFSRLPLTMRRLIQLMDGTAPGDEYTGLVVGFLDFSVDQDGDPDVYRTFLHVESEYYPDLYRYYQWRTERWYRRTVRLLND